jgi:hypothetical protein
MHRNASSVIETRETLSCPIIMTHCTRPTTSDVSMFWRDKKVFLRGDTDSELERHATRCHMKLRCRGLTKSPQQFLRNGVPESDPTGSDCVEESMSCPAAQCLRSKRLAVRIGRAYHSKLCPLKHLRRYPAFEPESASSALRPFLCPPCAARARSLLRGPCRR